MTVQRKTNWLTEVLLIATLLAATAAALYFTVANAQTARTAVIQYAAVSTRTDGTGTTGAISYEVWQGIKGAAKTRVGTITSLQTTINTGLLGGNEYCWHIVVVEAGNPTKSDPSTEGCKAFPQAGPNVVTITVT